MKKIILALMICCLVATINASTVAISTTSEELVWVEACSETEQCEVEAINNSVGFIESSTIPTELNGDNKLQFLEDKPRLFNGDGISKLWVLIKKDYLVVKRPYRINNNAFLYDGNGNPIGSLNGAINIHDADVHDILINELFHRHTGVATTLAVASLAGATAIDVVNATGFIVGTTFQIENGVIETTFPTVTAILGTVLTLDRPLDNSFAIGDSVEVVETNMAVVGTLASPVSFRLIPDRNQTWHIVRFLLGMIHSGAADDSKFGDLAALTNGVVLRGYNATANQYRTFTVWKDNEDIKMDMFDVTYTDKAGGGLYGTNSRGSIRLGTGAVPKISGIDGDYVEILIQDDLTALDTFQLKGQGHVEGQ